MSVQQLQNFKTLKHIFRQLSEFGLNPYEWQIDRTSLMIQNDGQVAIKNRYDHDFRMAGILERTNKGISVSSLSVISI